MPVEAGSQLNAAALNKAIEDADKELAELGRQRAEVRKRRAGLVTEKQGHAENILRAATAPWTGGPRDAAGGRAGGRGDVGVGVGPTADLADGAPPDAEIRYAGVSGVGMSASLWPISSRDIRRLALATPAHTGVDDASVRPPVWRCESAAAGAAAGAPAAAANSAAGAGANCCDEAEAESPGPPLPWQAGGEGITRRARAQAAPKKRAKATKAAPKKRAKATKASPRPGARAGKGGAGTTKGAAAAGGAVKSDAARVRAWRLRGGIGVYWNENKKRWRAYIWYGEPLHLGYFKTKEDAIACRLLGEDRIDAGCHPETGKYVPPAKRPKPPKTRLQNNAHLLGKPAQKFSDAALGEHATDLAAKVDAGTLDIDQVAGVDLHKVTGKWRAKMRYKNKWRAKMRYKNKQRLLGSHTSDLAEAIRYRLLAEKAIALSPDKSPQDYVAAGMAAAGAAAGAGKKRKRSLAVDEEEE